METLGFPNCGIGRRAWVWIPFAMTLFVVFTICLNVAASETSFEDLPSLAIFPFYLSGATEARAPLFMDSLYDVLEDTRKFIPKYSWYEGDSRYKPASLRRRPALEDLPGRVWKEDGTGPKESPDRDVVFTEGARLGADAVILYAFHVSGYGNDVLRGYLFDVARKRMYTAERKGKMVYVFTGEILKSGLVGWIHDITRELFLKKDSDMTETR